MKEILSMRSENPKKEPRKSYDLPEAEALKLKLFMVDYMKKHRGANARQVRRAAEKEFNIIICDKPTDNGSTDR